MKQHKLWILILLTFTVLATLLSCSDSNHEEGGGGLTFTLRISEDTLPTSTSGAQRLTMPSNTSGIGTIRVQIFKASEQLANSTKGTPLQFNFSPREAYGKMPDIPAGTGYIVQVEAFQTGVSKPKFSNRVRNVVIEEGKTTDLGMVILYLISKGVLTTHKTVDPSAKCPSGGVEIYSGIDENDNGTLDATEIDVTDVVCHGDKSLTSITNEPNGTNCATGGKKISVGLDNGEGGGLAGNGILEGGETDSSTYVCNGATGTTGIGTSGATGTTGIATLIKSSTANAPALCPNGGLKVDSGLDNGDGGGTANNGILEEVEVDATSYVCNGATGDKGDPSTSGYNTLITITTEIPGNNCTSGGKKIESGLDNGDGGGTASNGTLESGEVDYSTYVCNGTDTTPPQLSSTNPVDGATGADVTSSISVTFNEAMNTATITTLTSGTTCSGSIQLFTSTDASSDSNFNNCVPMNAPPVASNNNKTFTITPASSLSTSTRYKIRVTTSATDYTGNALAVGYTQTAGFIKNEVPTISASIGNAQNTLAWSSVTGATSYNLYWSTTTGVTTSNGTKISSVTSPYTHTSLTNGTAYYYILTAVNTGGESSASTEVSATPVAISSSVSFTDTDYTSSEVAGPVTISKADSESTMTHYVLYWGSSSTTKQSTTAITEIAANGSATYTYTFAANTTLPSTASHLLVYTKNGSIESPNPVSVSITDLIALPDSGQTISYSNSFGEDHDYLINPQSFTDNGNSTITDNVTGLMWQQTTDATNRDWATAGTYCDILILGGFSDWRLPSKKELVSIISFGTSHPAINTTYFPNTYSSTHWSSTTFAPDPSWAGLVSFHNGDVNSNVKTVNDNGLVRCVRGGTSGIWSLSYSASAGTVTDNARGLMWQQTDDGTTRTWEAALSYCEGLSLGGFSDWRLPNVRELESITLDSTYSPAINTTYFQNTQSDYYLSHYWSSTTLFDDTSIAWIVNFFNGKADSDGLQKTSSGYVRCVRGGRIVYTIPTASITIDGNIGDWQGIDPVISDKENDKELNVSGGDLKAIYLAKNGNTLFIRFELYTDNINNLNHYRIWFDNNKDSTVDGDINDRQVDVQGSTVDVQSMQEPYGGGVSVQSSAVSNGSNLEISLNISESGISNSFMIFGAVRDSSYVTIDWADVHKTVDNN
ncbi:DUF1566 domain-containing protein [Deltaproteobacteria bacterium TL4]